MNHGKMKLFSLLMVPLFVALSFAAAKTTLVQADSSVSSIQEIESVARLTGPSVPGSGLDFELTSAVTGSLTISGVRVSSFGATFATIEWETDDPGNSVVRYDTTDPLPLSSLKVTIPVTATNHVVSLIDLDPGTKYFYEVETNDIDGDKAVDGLHSFTRVVRHLRIKNGLEGGGGRRILAFRLGICLCVIFIA